MIIDSHVHIGDRDLCEYTVKNSPYKDIYRAYGCIDPEVVSTTSEFLKDVDRYWAIPLFFCEYDIDKTNEDLLNQIKNDEKAVPILLLTKNESLDRLKDMMQYKIIKEHFMLHSPLDITDRDDTYDYLSQIEGYLLLHTLSKHTVEHIQNLRKEFPNMNIITAHLARNNVCDYDYTCGVIDLFKNDDRIFADISTVHNPLLIKYAMEKYGKDRLMYGSDFPFEKPVGVKESDFIQVVLDAKLKEDELESLYHETAERIERDAKIKRIGVK